MTFGFVYNGEEQIVGISEEIRRDLLKNTWIIHDMNACNLREISKNNTGNISEKYPENVGKNTDKLPEYILENPDKYPENSIESIRIIKEKYARNSLEKSQNISGNNTGKILEKSENNTGKVLEKPKEMLVNKPEKSDNYDANTIEYCCVTLEKLVVSDGGSIKLTDKGLVLKSNPGYPVFRLKYCPNCGTRIYHQDTHFVEKSAPEVKEIQRDKPK